MKIYRIFYEKSFMIYKKMTFKALSYKFLFIFIDKFDIVCPNLQFLLKKEQMKQYETN